MMNQGFAGVFITLFNEHGEVITNKVTKFNYIHSDKLEDNSTIVIKFEKPELADHPNLQVEQRIIVVWGYTNEKELAQKRILWIYDVKHDFTDLGLRVTLECMCKAGYFKFTERTGAGELSLDDIISEFSRDAGINYKGADFSLKGIPETEVDIDIDTSGPSTVGQLSTKNVVTVDDSQKSQADLEKHLKFVWLESVGLGLSPSQIDINVRKARADFLKPKLRVHQEFSFDPSLSQVARDATSYRVKRKLVIPGVSAAQVIEEQRKRNAVNQLLVTGRDDYIFVTKRNWNQKSYKSYTYKKGSGYLLKFLMSTHNKEAKKQGSQIDFSSVNPFSKSIDRGSVDGSNNLSPALGRLTEMTREGLSKLPQFADLSVMVSGLRKKTITAVPGVEGKKIVEYSEVQFVNPNDTYVAITTIRGTTQELLEYDSSQWMDDPVPEKYSKPPIAGALGYTSINGSGLSQGRNFTERGRLNNATHQQEEWDGKGVAVIERMVPVNVASYISLIEETVRHAAQTAFNMLTEDQLALREASMDVIGDPSLISGKIISIANVGEQWSGNYYIHKVNHQVDIKGYICKCEMYKNSMGKIAGVSSNLIDVRDLGIASNNDIAAVEAKNQGKELAIIKEELRPEIANQD